MSVNILVNLEFLAVLDQFFVSGQNLIIFLLLVFNKVLVIPCGWELLEILGDRNLNLKRIEVLLVDKHVPESLFAVFNLLKLNEHQVWQFSKVELDFWDESPIIYLILKTLNITLELTSDTIETLVSLFKWFIVLVH